MITIKTADTKPLLREFVKFPLELYKDCDNWVPALEGDEYDTLRPETNGAYEYCDAELFLAIRTDALSAALQPS